VERQTVAARVAGVQETGYAVPVGEDSERRHASVTTKELIEEAVSLPVEERALVAESILRSLNAPDPDIDRKWAVVARRRLAELREGARKPVPGEEVFRRIWERFSG
jgi:hypothetical protein